MKKAESESRFETGPLSAADSPQWQFHWGDYLTALGVALAAITIYLLTLAPTVTGEDSGELVTAAYFLGIPHPPGYPLWCMFAHAFTWIPCGAIAWRVAFMSAFFASATVFLTALLVIGLTRRRIAGAAGALALAFSFEFWEQSVIAETYSLNAFFLAACLLLCWRWHATRRDGNLWALAVIFGVSLGNHYTMVVIGPVFAAFIFLADEHRWRRTGLYTAMIAAAALSMLLVFLYLPIRSAANPPIDWGNPETLGNFWAVIRRKQFAFMFSQYTRNWGRFAHQMQCMGTLWMQQFGLWSISALGAIGLAMLIWRRAWHGWLLAAIGIVTLASAAYVQNFNFDREWIGVMSVFGIPAYFVTAIGLGVLVSVFPISTPAHFARAIPALAAAVFLALVPLRANYHDNDKSDYYWAEDYGRNILNSLEPNAIYIPETDHGSFPVLYLQAIEGLRPDILIGRKCGYVESALFQDMPEEKRALYGEFPFGRYEPEIFAWLLAHTKRPVYFGAPPKLPLGSDVTFLQEGLVFRAMRPGETPPEARDWWAQYRWHTLEPADTRGDDVAELILYEIHFAKAREAFSDGRREEGLAHVAEALTQYGRDEIALNNAGALCARFGEYKQAREYFFEALTQNPQNETSRKNLERAERRLEK